MKPKLSLHPVVYVLWRGCTHLSEMAMTKDEVEAETLIEMYTVGHLIADRKDAIALGMEWIDETGSYRHITWIPKVNIVAQFSMKASV